MAIPRRRLSWSEDPLYKADKERITAPQAKAGLDYNRRLYAPDSDEMRRVMGRPVGPAPTTIVNGPNSRSIVSRYGTATITVRPASRLTPSTPAAPSLTSGAPMGGSAMSPDTISALSARYGGAVGPTGDDGTGGSSAINDQSTAAKMPEAVRPPAENAAQRWNVASGTDDVDEERKLFMERGGSSRKYNKMRVNEGYRPKIDARAKSSQANAQIAPVKFNNSPSGWVSNTGPALPY